MLRRQFLRSAALGQKNLFEGFQTSAEVLALRDSSNAATLEPITDEDAAPHSPSLDNRPQRIVYDAPFAPAVKKVKRLSLFSCACALAAGPVMLSLDGPTMATASVASTLGGFGIFTTGLMHWFSSPYTHRLEYEPTTDTVEVEVLNLLARPVRLRFRPQEAQPVESVHPLASFKANGRLLYLDTDTFPDKELLRRLVQSHTPAPKSEHGVTPEGQ